MAAKDSHSQVHLAYLLHRTLKEEQTRQYQSSVLGRIAEQKRNPG